MDLLRGFVDQWSDLSSEWKIANTEAGPLAPPSDRLAALESAFVQVTVGLLTSDRHDADLFASARQIRDHRVGAKIDLRAVIDLSNKCRVNCGFCPMRRENSHALPAAKASAEKIVAASEDAYTRGFRQLFLQAGEDTTIIRPVLEALQIIRRNRKDWHVILNLGSHRAEVYDRLHAAGADGYLIKHETANPELHLKLREEPLAKRVHHMLLARKSGMYIGSGNILGLPGQTIEDVARDLIFLGRINSSTMASSAPFTPSHDLPPELQVSEAGIFEKTLRFIALLRHCFPAARIPATSNLDSPHLIRPNVLPKSGQAMAIDAGANGVTVQFTPPEIEDEYGLYARGSEKLQDGYLVRFEKARLISQETGLPLGLKASDLKASLAGSVDRGRVESSIIEQAASKAMPIREGGGRPSVLLDRAARGATK